LAVVDITTKKVVYTEKIPEQGPPNHNHVNDITKTDDKTLFVVATNKGIALIKINDQNYKILVQKQNF